MNAEVCQQGDSLGDLDQEVFKVCQGGAVVKQRLQREQILLRETGCCELGICCICAFFSLQESEARLQQLKSEWQR